MVCSSNRIVPSALGRAPRRWALLLAMVPMAVLSTAQAATYEAVSAIFAARCILCHAGSVAAAGLRLDDYDATMRGSAKGPVLQSGNPAASELVRRVKGLSQPRMPMTGPPFLSDEEVATIERWIAAGLPRGSAAGASIAAAPPRRPRPGEPVTYAHVAPIFAQRCAKCHTDQGLMGPAPEGYRLTSHGATLQAQERARVVPGRPSASELVRRVRGQSRPRMPLDGPPYLNDDEIRLIEQWIAQGARATDGTPATMPAGASVRLYGTLEGPVRLDDLEFVMTPLTRIDKAPRPGAYVELRGRLDAEGRVIAERLRSR